MNTFFKRTLLMTGLMSVLFISSCEEELKLPENTVGFESDQQALLRQRQNHLFY